MTRTKEQIKTILGEDHIRLDRSIAGFTLEILIDIRDILQEMVPVVKHED